MPHSSETSVHVWRREGRETLQSIAVESCVSISRERCLLIAPVGLRKHRCSWTLHVEMATACLEPTLSRNRRAEESTRFYIGLLDNFKELVAKVQRERRASSILAAMTDIAGGIVRVERLCPTFDPYFTYTCNCGPASVRRRGASSHPLLRYADIGMALRRGANFAPHLLTAFCLLRSPAHPSCFDFQSRRCMTPSKMVVPPKTKRTRNIGRTKRPRFCTRCAPVGDPQA